MCNSGIWYHQKGILPCLILKSDSPKTLWLSTANTLVNYTSFCSQRGENMCCQPVKSHPISLTVEQHTSLLLPMAPLHWSIFSLPDRRSTLQVTSSCLTIAWFSWESCDHLEKCIEMERCKKKKKSNSLFPLSPCSVRRDMRNVVWVC